MRDTFRLGRIAGVPVGLHWSLLAVAALLAWGLAEGTLPEDAPGASASAYWAVGAAAAVTFLASILVHELAHAAVARRHGMPVEGITLWLLGGVARLGGDPPDARAELRVAVAGPLASLVVAALAGLGALGLEAGGADVAAAGARWLTLVEAVLVVFNLVPAAPLDGGRVLAAALWWRWGNRARAELVADGVGEAVGRLLVGAGVVGFLLGLPSGLWVSFLGWFVLVSARQEAAGVRGRLLLGAVRVEAVMTRDPVALPAGMRVEEVIEGPLFTHRFTTFPVQAPSGRVVGLLTLRRIKAVPAAQRGRATAADVAWPLADVVVAAPGDRLVDALARSAPGGDGRIVVMDGDRLVGIVSPTDVARLLERAALAGRVPPT